jgi:hypothetical protein
MAFRGICKGEVEQAIKCGAKEFQQPDKILFHFRYYVVVCKKVQDDYTVITVKPRW